MIDLSLTRREMLQAIGASFAESSLPESTQRNPVSPSALRLRADARKPEELVSFLNAGLVEHFLKLSPNRLLRDILQPLKKALGNAYKRGNCEDPDKRIEVELVITHEGVVIAVSDEGSGFDVESTVDRFRRGEKYYTYRGVGLATFEQAESLISYERSGSTFLLCCRGAPDKNDKDKAAGQNDVPGLGYACDETLMTFVLGEELGQFRQKGSVLESCRIYVPARRRTAHPEIRYLLQYRKPGGKSAKSKVLTGRVLTEEGARREFDAAKQLFAGPFKDAGGVKIPKPMRVKQYPGLVLYDFDPVRDFRELVQKTPDRSVVQSIAELVGNGLRTLHTSSVTLAPMESHEEVRQRCRNVVNDISQMAANSTGRVGKRLQRFVRRWAESVDAIESYEVCPIHGSFGWDCIFNACENYYFCGFDHSCSSHPGFDVGGFLAESIGRRRQDHSGSEHVQAVNQAFLRSYGGGRGLPFDEDMLVVAQTAILARIAQQSSQPLQVIWPRVERILDLLEHQ